MIDGFLKKIELIFNKGIEYHKMVNIDWSVRFIGMLLLLLYLLGVLIFDKNGPYVPSSQKNKLIKNDIMIGREDNKK